MIVSLHPKQRVLVNSVVRFRHYTIYNTYHEIVLNREQFLNLEDVIDNLYNLKLLNYYPLGGGIWLYYYGPSIKLYNNHSNIFFRFYRSSYTSYLKTRRVLRRFLRDGRSSHYQSNAKYGCELSNRFRGDTPITSKFYKTLSRSTRDACDDPIKQSKCANVSKRENSNPRVYSERRSGKDDKRSDYETEGSCHNESLSSDEDDCLKHGSEYTIEEEAMSTEDCDE